MTGNETADECLVKYLKKANCPFICLPILFNYLNESIPFCSKNQDYLCMLNYYETKLSGQLPCYGDKQTRIIKYQGEHTQEVNDEVFVNDLDNIYLRFEFRHLFASGVTTLEERNIMTTADFIGSVGGSLGLFLGFSFFAYLSNGLDRIFNRIDRMFQ